MIAHIIEILAAWIISVISALGYGGVMLLMAIESACIPLPSEIIMPFSGYLVYTGRFSLLAVATWGAIGCNVGSVLAYEIGYYGGRPLAMRYGHYIFVTQARTRHGRSLLCALGIAGGADRAPAAGDPDVHRAAGGDRAHAAAEVSRLHVRRIVAVVLRAGVRRHAAGRAVGQGPAPQDVVPSHGRRDSGGA